MFELNRDGAVHVLTMNSRQNLMDSNFFSEFDAMLDQVEAASAADAALVIHGDEDPILPLDHGEATAGAIPGAKLIVLRGVGHELPEGCKEEYFGPILDHLKTNS